MLNLNQNLRKTYNKFSAMKTYEILLVAILILYLISGVNTPYNMAPYVNNLFMYMSLLCIIILLYLHSNILLVILFAVSALIFINRSNKVSHVKMAPSENNKTASLNTMNTHLSETTLEETIVGQISRKVDNTPSTGTYNPVMCTTYNASEI
jgi:hypothetical protein